MSHPLTAGGDTVTIELPSVANGASAPQELSGQSLAQLEARIAQLETLLAREISDKPDPNALNLLVFEGYRDRLLAAFVMATGAAACGMQVNMFFTFWGTAALRRQEAPALKKSLVERAFGMLLPRSSRHTKLSQLDMCGVGRMLMQREMKNKNIADLGELIDTAAELGVKISVCEMSMRLMGIQREELIEYPHLEYCGVAQFIDLAAKSNTTLFV